MQDQSTPKALTQSWIDRIVIGENICPFAREAQTHLIVSDVAQLSAHIEAAITKVTDPDTPINNALVIVPDGLSDFDDFWNVCETLEANLEQSDLLSIVQLAHFHPRYQFEGLESADRANWTNRSPFPVLHFLCAQTVENSVHQFRDATSIPERNIRHLRALSEIEFQRRFNLQR
jgi:uncharacterized protein